MKSFAKKLSGGLFVIMIAMVLVGALYLILLLPTIGISILGVPAAKPETWGFLTWFEVFWQPICAGFYFLAAWQISRRKHSAKLFTLIAIGCTVFEALMLNIYQFFATRQGILNDGIFQNSNEYPLAKVIIFVGFAIGAWLVVFFYFQKSSRIKRILTD